MCCSARLFSLPQFLNARMRIDVKQVLKRAAEREQEVKPLPQVRIFRSQPTAKQPRKPKAVKPPNTQLGLPLEPTTITNPVLAALEKDYAAIQKERAILSTRTAFLVIELEAKLRAQHPGMADEFMKGKLPMPELKDHYAKIQALSDKMLALWDTMRYVEQYGEMPQAKPVLVKAEQSVDVMAVQHQIRRLDDLIYKCNNKLRNSQAGIKAPKNSERVNQWKEKIALAEAERNALKHQLKRLQYEARN